MRLKCVQKIRNKNNTIIGYKIQDSQGNIRDISSKDLKQAIVKGTVDVINLKLTSDNRLIDIQPVEQTPQNKKVQYVTITRKIIKQRSDLAPALFGISVFIWLRGMYVCVEWLAICWGWIR